MGKGDDEARAVVGGAGYIGGWLTDKLIEAGYETRVFDLLLYEERFLKTLTSSRGRDGP